MNSFDKNLLELRTIIEAPKLYLSKYFADLRTEIDLDFAPISINNEINIEEKESNIKIWIEMINRINQFEKECLKISKKAYTNNTNEIFRLIETNSHFTNDQKLELIEKEINRLKKILFLNQIIIYNITN